jgi:DUF218 domain
LETRPFAAAALYKNGFAAKILVSDVKPSPAEKLGVVASRVDQNRAVLLKLGIPAEAITGFGAGVTNTYEEARALAQWSAARGAKRIIVPTELFSSRRVHWIVTKELRRTGMRYKLGTNQRRTLWGFDVSAEVDCGREPLDLWPIGSNRRHFGRGSERTVRSPLALRVSSFRRPKTAQTATCARMLRLRPWCFWSQIDDEATNTHSEPNQWVLQGEHGSRPEDT